MRGLEALRTLVEAFASPDTNRKDPPRPEPQLGRARQLDPCMTGVL